MQSRLRNLNQVRNQNNSLQTFEEEENEEKGCALISPVGGTSSFAPVSTASDAERRQYVATLRSDR